MSSASDHRAALETLRIECERLRTENAELRTKLGLPTDTLTSTKEPEAVDHTRLSTDAPVTHSSTTDAKVTLFHDLFQGREEIYPVRWELVPGVFILMFSFLLDSGLGRMLPRRLSARLRFGR